MRWRGCAQSLVVVGFLVIGITAFHALAYWAAPYGPVNGETTAWAVIVLYQGAVLATSAIFAPFGVRRIGTSGISREQLLGGAVRETCGVLAAITALGLALHYIGKSPLLAEAKGGSLEEVREIFLRYPREKLSAVERMASKAGHLLSNFYAPGLIVASVAVVSRGWSGRGVACLIVFVSAAVGYAFPMVSRSVLLTALWIVLCASVGTALTVGARGRWRRSLGVTGVVAVVVIALSAVVFIRKIERVGPALVEDNVADFLPIRQAQSEEGEGEDVWRRSGDVAPTRVDRAMLWEGCAVCALILTYVNHGIWNLASVVSTEERGRPVLFAFVRYWGDRLGVWRSQGERREKAKRVYGPGGLTLPGAAYHDFGWPGVVLTGVAVGALLGVGMGLMRSSAWWPEGVAIFVLGGIVEGESLLFVAPGTLSFPFVAVATLAWLLGMRAVRWRNTRGRVASCDDE